MKIIRIVLILLILSLPTFSLMIRPGIFSMHDPHIFRIQEFHACIVDGIFPCRWAADSGKGFGEPIFNFYSQLPYWFTETFIRIGFSLLDSAKFVYILSLILSAFTMFLFSRKYWGVKGGLISGLFYIYAPYRAVDVWVRGALPEALAFIFYPLILYALDKYLDSKKTLWLLGFCLSVSALVTTHNLSLFMFLPFLFLYYLFRSVIQKQFFTLPAIILGISLVFGLSAYYLLPVLFESGLVSIQSTTEGYYNFHIHFTTLNELFISRYWGYGASLWARKYLSVSIGQVHWVIALLLCAYVFLKKKFNYLSITFLVFVLFGLLALFLTHGKSSILWNTIGVMKYVQFPWRYLSVALFFFSLASGFLATVLKNRFSVMVAVILVILLNYSFFRPDIWRSQTDADLSTPAVWNESRSTSLGDFWPKTAPQLPENFAPDSVIFSHPAGQTISQRKRSSSQVYIVDSGLPDPSVVSLPIVYFPGWEVKVNHIPVLITPQGNQGLITFNLPAGKSTIEAVFSDTPIRSLGNMISLVSLITLPVWLLKKHIG